MDALDRIRTRAEARRKGVYGAWSHAGAARRGVCSLQHDFDIANASGSVVRGDVNDALEALATLSSGTSAPSTTYAHQLWADTTNGVLKKRNAANSGWIVVGTIDETFVLSRSSNTILDVSDKGKTIVATAGFTQTLDAAATLGDGWYAAYRVESGATVVFDPNAAENIDGAATKSVVGPSSGLLYCNGSAFFTVGFPTATSLTTDVARLLENVGLSVTMAANAVTIALKGADGNDPSTSNKVGTGFRNATLTNGQSTKIQVTAATSTVISSGSTGGTVSGEASRILVAAMNNAGAVELAWCNARSGTAIAAINEGGLISTTAEGGAGAADSAQTWYSTSARTNVPFTIIGYFDSTQATAGTWASNPSAVVVNPRSFAMSEGLTFGTSTSTTGGTAIDVSGIPEWVNEVDVMYAGLSFSGTSRPIIQIGPSGGVESSGYLGSVQYTSGATLFTDGIGLVATGFAAGVLHGLVRLKKVSGGSDLWVAHGGTGWSDSAGVNNIAFSKSISGKLSKLRLTTQGGTDTVDALTLFNITYRG